MPGHETLHFAPHGLIPLTYLLYEGIAIGPLPLERVGE